MDMTKGQGAQAEEMTLSALLKMLELSKFLTVEVMCEQYLSSHAEEGMAYLVMYAAKVKSATLHKFQKGDSVSCDFQETFPLYIEHRQLLETFFRHGEHAQVANVLHYMKAYLLDAMKVWETAQELPSSKDDFCDFAWMILNTIYSYDKSDFAGLSFTFGKHLLTKRAFEEAKEFFENAKAQGADKAECLLHILYATMKITSESEFITCKNFSMNMPEYINLIVAIGDNADLLQKVITLAEENIKARTKPRKQPVRKKRSDKQAQRRPLNKEKVKKALVFGGPFAFAVITLILIFAWIIPSVRLQGLIFGISDDGEYAIVAGYQGDASKLVIPEKYKGLPIKGIAIKAFADYDSLTSITIPSSVQKVDGSAFSDCSNLQTVTFRANSQLSSIGSYAFENCTSLTSITIPDSVQIIDNFAFYGCSNLQTVTFGENSQLSSISEGAFKSCSNLTSIHIPSSVQKVDDASFSGCSNLQTVTVGEDSQLASIGGGAFYGCDSLTSITIPSSVQKIDNSAFYYCSNLGTVTFGEDSQLSSIGYDAFRNCTSLTSITIPDSVTSIGSSAFENCTSLTSITIPDSVTSIGFSAFEYCTSLTSITIPDSVTSIGSYAFSYCTSLKSIKYRGTRAQWDAITKGSNWNADAGNYTIVYNYIYE